jgi:hypothetical protein
VTVSEPGPGSGQHPKHDHLLAHRPTSSVGAFTRSHSPGHSAFELGQFGAGPTPISPLSASRPKAQRRDGPTRRRVAIRCVSAIVRAMAETDRARSRPGRSEHVRQIAALGYSENPARPQPSGVKPLIQKLSTDMSTASLGNFLPAHLTPPACGLGLGSPKPRAEPPPGSSERDQP